MAYVYSGKERYQAILDVFMKSVPSDLRLNPEEFENFITSTKISRGFGGGLIHKDWERL